MSPIDFEIWLNHFEHHDQHPSTVPMGTADILRPQERRLIATSIATFQLGEQSDGRTFMQAAQHFALTHGVPTLARIAELLIREERRHAAMLRVFMEEHLIARKTTDCTDRVFRMLRRFVGLEFYLHILVSAELIGIVYYRALERVTGCQRLRALCRVLVADELAHVGFESQLLLALRRHRPAPVQILLRRAHRAFFTGTAVVVWLTHRSVLRRAGHGARSFLRACRSQHAFHLDPVNVAPHFLDDQHGFVS